MDYHDRSGHTVQTVRKSLPIRTADFPSAEIIRHKQAMRTYRLLFTHCQVCEIELGRWGVRAEVHHIIGGAGRSDEFPNLILLCNGFTGCHAKAHGAEIKLAYDNESEHASPLEGKSESEIIAFVKKDLGEKDFKKWYAARRKNRK